MSGNNAKVKFKVGWKPSVKTALRDAKLFV